MFGEINSAISLFERIRGWFRQSPVDPSTSVATRFIDLFENHGVHRNQIPRFFDGQLRVSDLRSPEALISKLDEETLTRAARLFSVRREWLDGVDKQIYPLHDFYKKPQQFVEWLETQMKLGGSMTGDLFVARNTDFTMDALLIFQQEIGAVGDKIIYRYLVSNNWMYSYWKSRAYLAACVASAWKRDVYVLGHWIKPADVEKYRDGETFLGIDQAVPVTKTFGRWHPEDLALTPDTFLEGLSLDDAEYRSAIGLHIELREKGFMYVDVAHDAVSASEFSKRLK